MFQLFRILDPRICGAITQSQGLNTKVFSDNILAAVQGDTDTHNNLGALQANNPKVFIQGQPAIAALKDTSAPDVQGIIVHQTGLPIPAKGSQKVFIGNGNNGAGALGLGMLSGNMQPGELLQMGQQVIGQVSSIANLGGGGGSMQMNNMQGQPPQVGQTVVGQNTGATFTFTAYIDSRHQYPPTANTYAYPAISSIENSLEVLSDSYLPYYVYATQDNQMNLTQDDGDLVLAEEPYDANYIVLDDYFSFPLQNLTSMVITI